MMKSYKIVCQGGNGELVEEKSRSIADIGPMSGEEETLVFVGKIRKKYQNTGHRYFTYIIGDKEQTVRYSDDREPSQTTGRSMIDVSIEESLHDVYTVTIRYFGRTLLGTGGLVRVHSGAVRAGLEDRVIVGRKLVICPEVTTDYNGSGKTQYIATQAGMDILDVQCTDKIVFMFLMLVSGGGHFRSQITEGTSERVRIKKVDGICYNMGQGEPTVSQQGMSV